MEEWRVYTHLLGDGFDMDCIEAWDGGLFLKIKGEER